MEKLDLFITAQSIANEVVIELTKLFRQLPYPILSNVYKRLTMYPYNVDKKASYLTFYVTENGISFRTPTGVYYVLITVWYSYSRDDSMDECSVNIISSEEREYWFLNPKAIKLVSTFVKKLNEAIKEEVEKIKAAYEALKELKQLLEEVKAAGEEISKIISQLGEARLEDLIKQS